MNFLCLVNGKGIVLVVWLFVYSLLPIFLFSKIDLFFRLITAECSGCAIYHFLGREFIWLWNWKAGVSDFVFEFLNRSFSFFRYCIDDQATQSREMDDDLFKTLLFGRQFELIYLCWQLLGVNRLMYDSNEGELDHDKVSLLSQAERRLRDFEEMTSVSDASGLDQFGTKVDSVLACCELSSRVTLANRPGLDQLLDIALSEEFTRYYTTSFHLYVFMQHSHCLR